MRYFTHRNKRNQDRVIKSIIESGGTLVCERIGWTGESLMINAKADYRSGLHFEQGSGTPGRWWQEITEERAKELLGGGAR